MTADDCLICHAPGPHPINLTPPVLTRNMQYQPPCCPNCWEYLFAMLQDLPWIRYQISQYQLKLNHRGYDPTGCYLDSAH